MKYVTLGTVLKMIYLLFKMKKMCKDKCMAVQLKPTFFEIYFLLSFSVGKNYFKNKLILPFKTTTPNCTFFHF